MANTYRVEQKRFGRKWEFAAFIEGNHLDAEKAANELFEKDENIYSVRFGRGNDVSCGTYIDRISAE